jgi:hypothetical protein
MSQADGLEFVEVRCGGDSRKGGCNSGLDCFWTQHSDFDRIEGLVWR